MSFPAPDKQYVKHAESILLAYTIEMYAAIKLDVVGEFTTLQSIYLY
jgi:hypothetical protein